jgi:hypothetical protein
MNKARLAPCPPHSALSVRVLDHGSVACASKDATRKVVNPLVFFPAEPLPGTRPALGESTEIDCYMRSQSPHCSCCTFLSKTTLPSIHGRFPEGDASATALADPTGELITMEFKQLRAASGLRLL